VAHAAEGVAAAREAGTAVAFVTNNASRAPEEVAAVLTRLGVPAEAADVVTSGQAAARLVAERVPAGSPVLVTGSPALAAQVEAAGLRPVRTVAAAGEGGPVAVVQGLHPQTTWADLAEATAAVHAGALWVTGNRDSTLPSPRGPLPGNGTLVAAVATATGREPLVAGKPEPALHEESVARVRSARPLVVGDRLDTDVAGAVRAGAESLLVLTGVVDVPALLAAQPGERPTYVGADLRCLALPQPAVVGTADGAVCDGWRATVADGVVRVAAERGGGPAAAGGLAAHTAALRAACSAAWSAGRVVRGADGLPDPDDGAVRAGCGA
jgi:glycerol-1-phosphatase